MPCQWLAGLGPDGRAAAKPTLMRVRLAPLFFLNRE